MEALVADLLVKRPADAAIVRARIDAARTIRQSRSPRAASCRGSALASPAAAAIAATPGADPPRQKAVFGHTPVSAAAGCVSTADCLSKMTLAEKAGDVTRVANTYITNKTDITTYALGSVLIGGGGGPNAAGGTATSGPTWSTTSRATY